MNIMQKYKKLEEDDQFSEVSPDLEIIFPNLNAGLPESYIRGIENAPSESFLVLFLFISLGYMLPWTVLGSLISHYKHAYSASFYVQLYCAYYLPGLPIALIQYRYDVYLDLKFKSENTYFYRGVVSYLVMSSLLIGLTYFSSKFYLLLTFFSLGMCGWLCHGTASMLASMYPSSAIAYLQTGFRCPEIYSLIAVTVLHLGRDATKPNLDYFYVLSAIIVLICAIPWIYIVSSETSQGFFDIKDNKDNRTSFTNFSENIPLLAPLLGRERKISSHGNRDISEGVEGIIEERNAVIGQLNDIKDVEKLSEDNDSEQFEIENSHSTFSKFSYYARPLIDNEGVEFLLDRVENVAMQIQPNIGYRMSKEQFRKLIPLCLALFLVIFCSIFQSSFFCYVTSSGGRDIEQILYFVRSFSDLIGRPLTRLQRPFFLKVLIYSV